MNLKFTLKNLVILFTVILILASINSFGQNSDEGSNFSFDIGADLMSRYVWRGTQFGDNSPSIQPYMNFDYKNFEIGSWGAYSISGLNRSQEMDLHLSYYFVNQMFTLTVTDYFFPSDTASYKYFNYGKNTTGHIFETSLAFNGIENFPVSFSANVNVYGNDAITIGNNPSDTSTFNKKTGIQYSNYFEISYANTIKNIDYSLFLGFTLNNPKNPDLNTGYIGEVGFYGKRGIVNVGLTANKSISISDKYSLPVTVSLISNPETQKVFLVFGISF